MSDAAGTARATRLELDDRHVAVWRDEFCDRTLAADAPWSRGQRLAVHLDMAALRGVLSLDAHVLAGGPTIERGLARVAHDDRPALGLSVVTSGSAELTIGGTRHELRAGDVCFLDSRHPFVKRMGTDYRELFLYTPLAVAGPALGRAVPDLAPTVAPRRALTALLADTLGSIRRHAAGLRADDWPALLGAVLGLATAVFAPAAGDHDAPAQPVRLLWRQRVLRYIDDHLGDPALTPAAIARALRISRRYLHRVFEDGDSVGATVLARRLDRCRALLALPAHDHRSISEIAFDLGFNSAPHFSRSFRARFGVSARTLRVTRACTTAADTSATRRSRTT